MTAQTLNRFEWVKAVAQSDLLDRAKVVAWALAVNFCNEETGRTDPGLKEISKATGKTIDTLKRAIRDLIGAGWLSRTEGRGAGNKTVYTFLSPGKVVLISQAKRAANTSPEKGGRGAPLDEKKGARVHLPIIMINNLLNKRGRDRPNDHHRSVERWCIMARMRNGLGMSG